MKSAMHTQETPSASNQRTVVIADTSADAMVAITQSIGAKESMPSNQNDVIITPKCSNRRNIAGEGTS